MQIPILQGIYTSEDADYRTYYPRNLEPVALNHGISQGYLRPAPGVTQFATQEQNYLPDRGAIKYEGRCIRVLGNYLVEVMQDGGYYEIGSFSSTSAGNDQVSIDYSFDYVAIANGGNLYIWDGGVTITQNTDTDLGLVLDVIYIDGYFMTTDGAFLVITELGNPLAVNPLKYGSSEVDPDPIVGLIKINNQVYAMNRHTIEAFYNKGGSLFPFDRIEGSRMNRGLIGTHAKCEFKNAIAFLGSGRNEPPSVWIGINSETHKIATREIDQILQDYSEEELKQTVFEKRVDKNHEQIWIRLPDQILVYDDKISQAAGIPIWFIRDTGPRNMVWVYDKMIVGNDDGQVGYLDDSTSNLWGESIDWEFRTKIIYNESKGAILHELELVGLPGRVVVGENPTIWTSYSIDGETWSNECMISAGQIGERDKRLVWLQQGRLDSQRIQRFRGNSDSHLSIARLEARVEGLNY
jgi:hypothetical protein